MMILCGSHYVFYTTFFFLPYFSLRLIALSSLKFHLILCISFFRLWLWLWVRKTKNENISAQYHATFIHTSSPYTALNSYVILNQKRSSIDVISHTCSCPFKFGVLSILGVSSTWEHSGVRFHPHY